MRHSTALGLMSTVVPAPSTTVAEPSAGYYYERLAPGGGYLPAEYMPGGMPPMQYHPQAGTSGYMPMPPLSSGMTGGGVMTGGYMPMPPMQYHPQPGYQP